MRVVKSGKRSTRRTTRSRYQKPFALSTHGMHTRLRKVTATKHAVLNTTELLESILGHLDPLDMLKARLINRNWKEAIDSSPALQRQLTLRAPLRIERWTFDNGTEILKPYVKDEELLHGDDWVDRQGLCVPTVVNPVFLSRDPNCASGKISIRHRFKEAETLRFAQQPSLIPRSKKSIKGNTFVTIPPVFRVQVSVACMPENAYTCFRRWDMPEEKRRVIVRRKKGVRWRDIEKALQYWLTVEGHRKVGRGELKLDLKRTAVWAIGAVFYNEKEAAAVRSGAEAKIRS